MRPFHNKFYASKEVNQQILSHISRLFTQKLKLATCQHCPNRFLIKLCRKKAFISLQNRFFGRRITFRHTFSHSNCPLAISEPFPYKAWIQLLATHSLAGPHVCETYPDSLQYLGFLKEAEVTEHAP